ncbi:MAG: hypothetical protein IJN86_02360 [Clostridia bacterium]|nr:hypothetical protein [Clostridia bacterium]MBQ7047767.1 hypothetical protein [Clostridia bacterium]
MKEIGNIYQYEGKTVIIESFYGKEQEVAICRYAKPKYSDFPEGSYKYETYGKTFELSKSDLQSAKRINSACDNCIFYRSSMHKNDVNYSRAWCAYRTTLASDMAFFVDCTKHKTEKGIKKAAISAKKAKEVFNIFFKDCRLICESGIESNNKTIRIESVSKFEKGWFMAERLVRQEYFDSLLEKASGNIVVIENFPMLLEKHQSTSYLPNSSHLKACEISAKTMDYDTYVYFCSEFGCNAFLFKELGVGIFTLHELTYQITI